ncbi:MAG: hypothetical protein HYX72_10140 [Acidobacteria bacterium]|nr:hypothetical protein [Acidobacteriota bacterium]
MLSLARLGIAVERHLIVLFHVAGRHPLRFSLWSGSVGLFTLLKFNQFIQMMVDLPTLIQNILECKRYLLLVTIRHFYSFSISRASFRIR